MMPLQGAQRQIQRDRRFGFAHAGEQTAFGDAAEQAILAFEFVERAIQIEQTVGFEGERGVVVIERHMQRSGTAFLRDAIARVIAQHLPHRPRGNGEEMFAIDRHARCGI